MMTFTNAQLDAAGSTFAAQTDSAIDWAALSDAQRKSYRDKARAVLEASVEASKIYAEEHIIGARFWRRRDEWVLELTGAINDTPFTIRHPQSGALLAEEVPSLPEYEYRGPKTEGDTEAGN
jgi:hypothetical protein